MAFRAADTFGDMNAVIEKHIVGQGINARPADRGVISQALTIRREHFCIGPDLRVTCHANRRRRHPGVGRSLNRRVAVAAVKAKATDVMLMAKWDRLLWCKSFLGVVSDHWNDPDCQNQTNN